MPLIRSSSRAALAAGLLGVLALGSSPSGAAVYPLPAHGALIGHDRVIHSKSADTLLGIARRYSVGYWEIQAANPHVHLWLPGQGTPVVIPGRYIIPPVAHVGIVVNLAAHRCFTFRAELGTTGRW